MGEFLDVARNLLSTQRVENKKDHFERVFRAVGSLQAVHSKSQLDLTNIESIFTALEISNVLGKLPEFDPDDIKLVIASLKELIVATLEATIDFPTRHCPAFYKRLPSECSSHHRIPANAFVSRSYFLLLFSELFQ